MQLTPFDLSDISLNLHVTSNMDNHLEHNLYMIESSREYINYTDISYTHNRENCYERDMENEMLIKATYQVIGGGLHTEEEELKMLEKTGYKLFDAIPIIDYSISFIYLDSKTFKIIALANINRENYKNFTYHAYNLSIALIIDKKNKELCNLLDLTDTKLMGFAPCDDTIKITLSINNMQTEILGEVIKVFMQVLGVHLKEDAISDINWPYITILQCYLNKNLCNYLLYTKMTNFCVYFQLNTRNYSIFRRI